MKIEPNNVYCIDAKEGFKHLEKNSVTLILTDPPYINDGMKTYNFLAYDSYNCLKPWGNLIFEASQFRLNYIFNLMNKSFYLYYYILFRYYLPHTPKAVLKCRNIINSGQSMLWYKKDFSYKSNPIEDFIPDFSEDNILKPYHKWQKNLAPYEYIIRILTNEGDLILDPFCGSGTTLLVCKKLNRRYIGFDIDPKAVQIAKERLGQDL